MPRRAFVAAFVLLLAAALPTFAGGVAAEVGLDPAQVYVQSISYGGTGCPQGSVANSFSNDRKSLTLIFDAFVASSGPGVPVGEHRKNCQLNINLHIPAGFTYSVATFDYRGYVQLADGLKATMDAKYSFQGEQLQAGGATRFAGPVTKDYLVRDTLAVNAWRPCGSVAPININAQVRITGNPGLTGQITVDSIDGKVTHILGLEFSPC